MELWGYGWQIGDYAWHEGNSDGKTHQVGLRKPNAWGQYDMHGNVREWVWDREGDGEYSTDAQVDPRGAAASDCRVFRGGCWDEPPEDVRAAIRRRGHPGARGEIVGFRVVRP